MQPPFVNASSYGDYHVARRIPQPVYMRNAHAIQHHGNTFPSGIKVRGYTFPSDYNHQNLMIPPEYKKTNITATNDEIKELLDITKRRIYYVEYMSTLMPMRLEINVKQKDGDDIIIIEALKKFQPIAGNHLLEYIIVTPKYHEGKHRRIYMGAHEQKILRALSTMDHAYGKLKYCY
jgi:hypothetical protein